MHKITVYLFDFCMYVINCFIGIFCINAKIHFIINMFIIFSKKKYYMYRPVEFILNYYYTGLFCLPLLYLDPDQIYKYFKVTSYIYAAVSVLSVGLHITDVLKGFPFLSFYLYFFAFRQQLCRNKSSSDRSAKVTKNALVFTPVDGDVTL